MQLQKDLLKISIFLELCDWTEGHHLLPQADHTGRVRSIGKHSSYGDKHVVGKAMPPETLREPCRASSPHLPLR